MYERVFSDIENCIGATALRHENARWTHKLKPSVRLSLDLFATENQDAP